MKTVLILSNDFTTIYNFRTELVKRLLKEEYRVLLSLPEDDRNGFFEELGCEVIKTPISRFGTNPLQDLKTYKFYKALIKEQKPDAVLSFTAKPNIYGSLACRKTKTKCICNVTGLGSNFQSENIIKKIMLFLQKYSYKFAKTVFFQNTQNMEYFNSKGIAKDNSKLLPGSGVNLEENAFEKNILRDRPKFVTVSRIRKDKGFDELFEAVRKAKADGLDAEFHVLGWYEDDSYKAVTEEMQEKYGLVVHGSVPHEQVHGIISECNFLIHPSYHEGMSNVILEAAATGLVCLASDINGCKEAIDDGKTGFLFNVKDADSLYEAVKKASELSQDEITKMSELSRQKMKNEFDREIVIEKYLTEINN